MYDPNDLSVFPINARLDSDGQLTVAGHNLAELANNYGTPLYVYDGGTIRNRVSTIIEALAKYYPGESQAAYAVKAYFSTALAGKLASSGIGADVVSLGELHVAKRTGFPADSIHLHGNNKTEAELREALDWGIQAIVVDSLDELTFLENLARESGKVARIWLRITPDLKVNTHPHIETSSTGSKFGLHIFNRQASVAINRAKSSEWLDLAGLHTHLGSQIFDTMPYVSAIKMLFALAEEQDYIPREISPGGGWGIRYTETDAASDDVTPWVKAVSETVQDEAEKRGWPLPKLVLEPGRWIIGQAGVALYRIGAQKDLPDGLHIAAVDGGMADNPRVALYQADYTARVAQRAGMKPDQAVRIVGRFCESSDVLIPQISLPKLQRGDVLAVPAAGAYQLSMASNYNFATRPAVLWLEDGHVEVMQNREHPDQPCWWMNI